MQLFSFSRINAGQRRRLVLLIQTLNQIASDLR